MSGAVTIRRLGPEDWQLWRDVRLAALADAPYAYSSTLEREEVFAEAVWRGRLSAHGSMTAVAFEGAEPAGTIAAFTPPETEVPTLVAAWVDPAYRGRGVGDTLVAEVQAWAEETGRRRIELQVADGNDRARRLFLRHGFVPTGEFEPLESNPATRTELMVWSAGHTASFT